MTRYLLDTNICIALLRGRAPGVYERLRRLAVDETGISSITLAELTYGAARSNRPAHHQALLVEFCAPLAILPFDNEAADIYGRVRAAVEQSDTPIGPLDTLIAAHALSAGAAVVTGNERAFRRVVGLHVENWLVT